MESELKKELYNLEKIITSKDYPKNISSIRNWSGADVIIQPRKTKEVIEWLGKQNLVITSQETTPRRRAVITKYAQELSWLFNELKRIFQDRIDYISKYDFYGSLAQAALDYLNSNKEINREELLLTVLNRARKFN